MSGRIYRLRPPGADVYRVIREAVARGGYRPAPADDTVRIAKDRYIALLESRLAALENSRQTD